MAGDYGQTTVSVGVAAATGILTGYIINQLIRNYQQKIKQENQLYNSAIFFPTPNFAPENPNSATHQLVNYLSSVKKCLKICVMSIDTKYSALIDLLIEKHRQGILVQIYTSKLTNAVKSVGQQLRNEGIAIRHKNYVYSTTMHNKFIIIDDKVVITGSLNWTNVAMFNQKENLIILNDKEKYVKKYCQRFDQLWEIYDEIEA